MARFTLYTDKNNDHRWKLMSGNDSVLARSNDGFRSKDECLKSLETVKREVVVATTDPVVQSIQPADSAPGSAVPPGAAAPSTDAKSSNPGAR